MARLDHPMIIHQVAGFYAECTGCGATSPVGASTRVARHWNHRCEVDPVPGSVVETTTGPTPSAAHRESPPQKTEPHDEVFSLDIASEVPRCRRGHAMTEDNVRVRPYDPKRKNNAPECKQCRTLQRKASALGITTDELWARMRGDR